MKAIFSVALVVAILFSPVLVFGQSLDIYGHNWDHASNGFYGPDPVVAGKKDGRLIFVCAGMTENGYQAGHLIQGETKCYVAWSKKYIGYSTYLVLQGSGKYNWKDRNKAVESDLVKLNPEDGYWTYICRYDNLPGKVVHGGVQHGICYTSYGSGNTKTPIFEVLVKRQAEN